ncbi:MAG TPA: FAD:protein FMN transferase [Desulfobacterales bacterium]|nr:FAD:protein FMN transferase [Desulfobacterales bacterium]
MRHTESEADQTAGGSIINRRKFLQIVAVAGAAGAGWYTGLIGAGARYEVCRRSQPMMGTILNLTLYGPNQDTLNTAMAATIDRMQHLTSLLNRHQPASEVGILNRDGLLHNPSPDLKRVLTLAHKISRRSGGAFDVTMLPLLLLQQGHRGESQPPAAEIKQALKLVDYRRIITNKDKISLAKPGMGITLDGIAKGYIVDEGITVLKRHGFEGLYVEAGGDLMVEGRKADNALWRIGIENPRPKRRRPLVVLRTSNRAIATSGDYMQAYSPDFSRNHIINPATGYSPPELASSTITAPDTALADSLATATMVMGVKDSLKMLRDMPGCEGYFISKNLTHHQSPGFFS